MSEEKVKNNIAYIFITYQLNKLQDQGFVTKEEAERLDQALCHRLGADYKFSCNLM